LESILTEHPILINERICDAKAVSKHVDVPVVEAEDKLSLENGLAAPSDDVPLGERE